jgi:hypothetical protein
MHVVHQAGQKIYLAFLALLMPGMAFSQTVTDNEIKKNITGINSSLEKLVQLNPRIFEYETEKYKHLKLERGVKYGFIAEELQQVFPHLVKQKNVPYMFGKNSYRHIKIKTVDEASLIPVLVAAIQEQQEQIEKLTQEIEGLKTKEDSAAK